MIFNMFSVCFHREGYNPNNPPNFKNALNYLRSVSEEVVGHIYDATGIDFLLEIKDLPPRIELVPRVKVAPICSEANNMVRLISRGYGLIRMTGIAKVRDGEFAYLHGYQRGRVNLCKIHRFEDCFTLVPSYPSNGGVMSVSKNGVRPSTIKF